MQEKEQARTEQATPFKLSEAKRLGQVAKSLDFNTFVMVSALLAVLAIWGESEWRALCEMAAQILGISGSVYLDVAGAKALLRDLATRAGALLTPFLVVGLLMAVVANWVQTGPIMSGEPLKPKFERLNPVAGFKRIMGKRMLIEGGKSVAKLLLFGSILYMSFAAAVPGLLAIGNHAANEQANWIGDTLFTVLVRLAFALVVVGLIDLAFVRWQFSREMMMSRRELKEEVKRREGDPQIRARIRELQRENLKHAKSLGRLPDADVLITNPHHLAVALRYDRNSMSAPIVLAKGADKWALDMRIMARQHGIPIFERRTLARRLFKRGILEQAIPLECFLDVARLYAEVAEMRRREARYEVSPR